MRSGKTATALRRGTVIRFGWSRGEEPLARVRAEWLLTQADLAHLLLAAQPPHGYDELREMTPGEVSDAVRGQLRENAGKRDWWSDEYRDDYPGEPGADEAEAWALAQVAKLG